MKGLIGNRYSIIEELGRGSVSTVYRALDTKENQAIALKILTKQRRDEESILRFKKEVEKMSRIDHPRIVKQLDCGDYDGRSFLAMELFEGKSLHERLKARKLSLDASVEMVRQVAEGLEYVHNRGILHRDLKPKNILIKGDEAKITDFCMARIVNLVEMQDRNAVQGTFPYISLEQAGLMPVAPDERSDLYSLGVIFYELVTGELPFKGEDIGSFLHQHIVQIPKNPRELNPEIPPVLEKVILKLLKKGPEERYQSAKGFLADLDRIIQLRVKKKIHEAFDLGLEDRKSKLSFHTGFIGRGQELSVLKEELRLAAGGKGRLCLISGTAGVGKTRLINELRPYAEENGMLFVSGKCNKYGASLPYSPFAEAVAEYVDLMKRKPPQEMEIQVRNIRRVLGELGGAITKIAPALETFIGKMPELVELEPERERMRFFNVAYSFFSSISTPNNPVIIFLDDLQWSDLGTTKLLHFIAPKLSGTHLLILGSYREEEIPKEHPLAILLKNCRESGMVYREINLRPLQPKEMGLLIKDTFGYKEEVPGQLLMTVQERTKGNPFYSLQMLRSLVDEKVLYLEESQWKFDEEKIRRVDLPSSLIELLLGRLDQLKPEIKRILTYASVIGREFSYKLLKGITKKPAEEILGVLDEALIHVFIWEKPGLIKGAYTFSHDKIREALYEKLGPEERRGLHEEIAGYLEEEHKDDIEQVIYDLAYHYPKGLNKDKALHYSIAAGDRAKSIYANEEVLRFYEVALALLEEKGIRAGDRLWLRLREGMGDAYCLLGEYDRSISCYKDVSHYTKTGLEKARLLEKQGYAIFEKGDLQRAVEYYEAGLKILNIRIRKSFAGTGVQLLAQIWIQMRLTLFPFEIAQHKLRTSRVALLRVKILLRLSYVYWFFNTIKCLAVHLFGINIAEHIGPTKELGQTYSGHGIAMSAIPFFKRGLKYQFRALEMAEKLNDPWSVAQSQSFLGIVHYYIQEWDNSISWLTKATAGLQRLGDPWENILAYIHLGYNYRNKSDFEEAQKYLQIAYDSACRVKDLRSMGQSLSGLCEVYAFKGEIGKAEELIPKAVEYCEKASDILVLAMALRDYAQILLRKGEHEKSIIQARRSKRLIEKYFFRSDYVVPTYLVLAEASLKRTEQGNLSRSEKRKSLKEAHRAVRWGLLLARSFKNYLGYAFRVKGTYACACGNTKNGQVYFEKSIQILRRQKNKYELERTLAEKKRLT